MNLNAKYVAMAQSLLGGERPVILVQFIRVSNTNPCEAPPCKQVPDHDVNRGITRISFDLDPSATAPSFPLFTGSPRETGTYLGDATLN